jgi:hypothetical protein
VSPWLRLTATGFAMVVKAGARAMEFSPGKSAIAVEKRKQLGDLISKLIDARRPASSTSSWRIPSSRSARRSRTRRRRSHRLKGRCWNQGALRRPSSFQCPARVLSVDAGSCPPVAVDRFTGFLSRFGCEIDKRSETRRQRPRYAQRAVLGPQASPDPEQPVT